jgi:sialate O-acetylesterase
MNLKRVALSITAFLCTVVFSHKATAQVKLAALFTDGMVLQQQTMVPIWGWDKAGAHITITTSWNNKTYKAVADTGGKFIVKIATPHYGGPYQVTVADSTPLVLNNVLIGEVWLLTGQSNMEMPLKGFKGAPLIGGAEAIAASKNSNIHLFTVPRSSKTTLQPDAKKSQWLEATPESVANFSATGYYFGRELYKRLNVPIGLIHCSYSGSSIQAWMDAASLAAFPEIKVPAVNDPIKEVSRTPTTLYNGMLYPIIGYGIKGIVWYQGESNYDNPAQYVGLFETMIKSWRAQWGIGNFPFYYAQIAPFDYTSLPPHNKGGKYNSAFIRDVQRTEVDKIPNTGMAVLLDIGEQGTIHPLHKEQGGTRLGDLAAGKTYGKKDFSFQSPDYSSLSIKGNTAIVKFKYADKGLTSNSKELTTFEIAGADKHFYPAKAVINGSTVTVSSDQVKEPVAVRYAFKDYTIAELFSTDGLPVSSFRTDDWGYDDAQ